MALRVNKVFRYSLLAVVCLTPLLISNSMMWGFYTPKELFFQVSVYLVLVLQIAKPKTRLRLSLIDLVVIAWLLLPVVLAIVARELYDFSRFNILLYLLLFYCFTQLIELQDKESALAKYLQRGFLLMSISGTLMALYGSLQHYGPDVFHPEGYIAFGPTVISTMGHANAFGGFLAIIFPFALHNFRSSTNAGVKVIHAMIVGAILWALVLTLSRGAWLALVGALVIFNFPKIENLRQRYFATWHRRIIAMLILVSGVVLSLSFMYKMNPDSAVGRLFIWRITWNMFAEHPVSGIGYDRYNVEYLNYQARFYDDPGNSIHFDRAANLKQADNEYLQILAETGVVGLLLFIVLLSLLYTSVFRILKATKHKTKNEGAIITLATSVTVVIIHSLVDNPLRNLPTQIVFYFALGMIGLLAKERGLLSLQGNFRFSFSNNWALLIVGLGLLAYNTYDVAIKGKAYRHWQNAQKLVAHGDWYDGIAEYEKAHRVLDKAGELKFHLGAAYAYTDQPEKAVPLIQNSQKNFNDKNIYIVLGSAHFQMGQFEEAEKSFRLALRMYPKLLLPRLWLAEMYLKLDRRNDALNELRKIIEIEPKVMTQEIRRIKEDARRLLEIYHGKENLQ